MATDARRAIKHDLTPQPFDPDRLPWEQQPTESDAAYRHFQTYLKMERRSLEGLPSGSNHSRRWSWVWRAGEWDRHIARLQFEDMETYQRNMAARHREGARALQGQVFKWLKLFEEEPERLRKLHPRDAIRMFEVAVKVERDAASLGDVPPPTTSQGRLAEAPPMIGDDEPDGDTDGSAGSESVDGGASTLAGLYGLPDSESTALADMVAEALMGVAERRVQ